MQIYFGNIRIDVTNNVSEDKFLFFKDKFSLFLHDVNANTVILSILEKSSLNSFCELLANEWLTLKKGKSKVVKLYVYSFSDLFDSFSKVLKIVHACGGVVINDNEEVLLMQRMGMWDLPKGKLEKNESFEECAVREVEEETNVSASILDFWLNTYHTYDTYGDLSLKITHWYGMSYVSGKMVPQKEEAIEKLEWVSMNSLEKYTDKTYKSLLPVFNKI